MILALTLTPSLLVGCGDHTSCSYAASEGGKITCTTKRLGRWQGAVASYRPRTAIDHVAPRSAGMWSASAVCSLPATIPSRGSNEFESAQMIRIVYGWFPPGRTIRTQCRINRCTGPKQ